MKKLLKLIQVAEKFGDPDYRAVRHELKLESARSLDRLHDRCFDGTLMNLICEELRARSARRVA